MGTSKAPVDSLTQVDVLKSKLLQHLGHPSRCGGPAVGRPGHWTPALTLLFEAESLYLCIQTYWTVPSGHGGLAADDTVEGRHIPWCQTPGTGQTGVHPLAAYTGAMKGVAFFHPLRPA